MPSLQRSLFTRESSLSAQGKPRFAEFFAGIGLMRMGLEAAGWEIAWANDIDETKYSMYDAHFRDAADHFVIGDVHDVDPGSIPDVQLATASFPCTDLSLAGGRAGIHAGESSAFWGFVDVMEGMGGSKPPLVLLENVTGFLTSHGGRDFEQAMMALNGLGYAVDPFVLDAKWFVPQSRARLFVVGRLDTQEVQGATLRESRLRPKAVVDFINRHPNIRWGLCEQPEPPRRTAHTLEDIVRSTPKSEQDWWSVERVQYLYDQMSPRHKAVADEMIAGWRWSFGTVFRRVRLQPDGRKMSMAELRTDGIAGCLRTPKGGSGRQILFAGCRGAMKARLLTGSECAKLMGADEFAVSGSVNEVLYGFGDAVCVPAVEWIATNSLGMVKAAKGHSRVGVA